MYERFPNYTDEELEYFINEDNFHRDGSRILYSGKLSSFIGVTINVDGMPTRMCDDLNDRILFEYMRRKRCRFVGVEYEDGVKYAVWENSA